MDTVLYILGTTMQCVICPSNYLLLPTLVEKTTSRFYIILVKAK